MLVVAGNIPVYSHYDRPNMKQLTLIIHITYILTALHITQISGPPPAGITDRIKTLTSLYTRKNLKTTLPVKEK